MMVGFFAPSLPNPPDECVLARARRLRGKANRGCRWLLRVGMGREPPPEDILPDGAHQSVDPYPRLLRVLPSGFAAGVFTPLTTRTW